MNIGVELCFHHSYNTGINRLTCELLKKFKEIKEHNFYIFYVRGFSDFSEYSSPNINFIQEFKCFSVFERILKEQFLLPFKLKKYNLNAMLCPANYGLLFSRIKQTVIVHDITAFRYPLRYSFFKRFYLKRIIPLTLKNKKIITDSRTSALDIKKFLKVDAKVVYPGIPLPFLNSEFEEEEDYIVHFSRNEKDKGIELFIDIALKLGIKAKIIGLHTENFHFFNKNIQILGYRQDGELIKILKKAKCVFSLSKYEGFNLPALEALALGKKTVLYDNSVNRELYEKYAFLINENTDIEEIKKILSEKHNADTEELQKKFDFNNYAINIIKELENYA